MNLKIGKGGAAFLSTMLISVGVLGGINLFTDTPPVANAGIDQTVEMGSIVQFDGSGSVGNNLDYTWYFRTNGDVGYGAAPTHTFSEEGIYEVGLLVRETTSYMMDLDIVKITVRNQIPIADAGQDMIVNEDDEVVFDAGGTLDSESDMATLVYEWDFADGMKGQGISPTHVYTRSGTYPAVLTVTDRWGAVGVDTVTITVNNPAPAANAGSDKTVNEGEYVYFDGSGSTDTLSDVPTLRYDWNFGDDGAYAANVWKDDGTYPVTLTVTDDDGAESTDNLNVHVRNVDPIVIVDDAYLIADITLRVAGERWHDVEMYLNESGAPREEFYVFREEGDPKEQEDTREKMKLSLGETWTAEVRYTPLDDPISGNILGANPAWIIIEFENGAFRKIQHPFNVARPETWNWNITLSDYFFLVDNKLDIDDWKGNPAIHFDYLVYDPGMDAETVTWTCGDDTVSKHYGAGAFPTFIRDSMNYTPKGDMQNITITVEDDDGGSSSTTLAFSDGMLSGLSPKVSAGDDSTAIEDGAVPFSGSARTTVSRAVTGYQWSFGDGQSAAGQSAEHAYAFSGTYHAVLRAWDDLGNTGIDIVRVDVSNADPVAVAGPDLMGLEDKIVHFDGSGSSDTPTDMNTLVYEWDFGDGTVGYGVSTSHVYSNAGSYTVTLTVMDNDYAASVDTLSVTVSNLAPIALAGPDRIVYGAPMGIEFVGVGLDTFSDISGLTYSWNFGDGTQSAGRITTHTYSAAGTYTVVLTVRDDNNAAATDTCTIRVGIDSDGDNLGDSLEISLGTDPNNWDTDGDHISDYWEIYVYGTDPALSDSDDDGLADWYEIAYLGHDVDVDGDGLMCPWDWDSDGDWIRDGDDPNPLVYNHADGTEATEDEIITVSNELGASVIIKYDGTSTAKAIVAETVPPEPLNKPVGPYLSITTTSTETYTAEIRIRIPDILPDGASEERLALYRWDNAAGKWLIAEKTGVDTVHHYVWAKSSSLSTWAVGDSEYQDSDEDGLTDWFERTTYHPIVSFDFETFIFPNPQGWTATGSEHLWELQSGVSHSNPWAWHAGGWEWRGSFLTSPWIDLGIAGEPRVSLWQRSGAEGLDVDSTHVKIYTTTSQKPLGYLPSSVNAWNQVTYDLSEYEGMTVQLEFYFYGYETSDHRYLDDISFEGKTDELVADTDGDGLDDKEEALLGTSIFAPNQFADLPYRVVNLIPDSNPDIDIDDGHMITQVKKVSTEERSWTDNDDVSISNIDKPGKLLYPAIGCPEFVVKSESRLLYFDIDESPKSYIWADFVEFDKISKVELNEINGEDSWWTRSIFGVNGRPVVQIPISLSIGLYDLTVSIDYDVWSGGDKYDITEEYTAWHSVQILQSYNPEPKFIQLTDVHIGEFVGVPVPSNANNRVGSFLSIINRINILEKPDFVIITGDLTDSGTEAETQYFKACLLQFEAPVFLTPGNHDNYWDVGEKFTDYRKYLNPPVLSDGEDTEYCDDYSFDYGDFHFIVFNSGESNSYGGTPVPNFETRGLTQTQLDWMEADQNAAVVAGKLHTFIFTHTPSVPDAGTSYRTWGWSHSHRDSTWIWVGNIPVEVSYVDNDVVFVNWINENPEIVAVFAGHTHQNHIFYDVSTINIDQPPDYSNPDDINYISPMNLITLPYSSTNKPYYIETDTACKGDS